ncbi:hypothetical protein P8452_42685 [Trifolium repens]|nr:hypothetical protein P8452_42685 [Trifolium repens]
MTSPSPDDSGKPPLTVSPDAASLSASAIAKLKEEDFIGAKGKLNLLQIKRISSFYTTGDDSDRDGFLFEQPESNALISISMINKFRLRSLATLLLDSLHYSIKFPPLQIMSIQRKVIPQ